VAPTSSCRTSVGVAVLDNHLYAVGGQDGVSCLSYVEKSVAISVINVKKTQQFKHGVRSQITRLKLQKSF